MSSGFLSLTFKASTSGFWVPTRLPRSPSSLLIHLSQQSLQLLQFPVFPPAEPWAMSPARDGLPSIFVLRVLLFL